MNKQELDEIENRVEKATPGPWGPYNANLPFYAVVTKPAESLSKHDSERESYWRIDDAIFIANAVEDVKKLLAYIAKLKAENWVLKDSQLRTYDGLVQENEAMKKELESWRSSSKR